MQDIVISAIPGVPEKLNVRFSVLYLQQVDNIFTSVGKTSFTEENDIKIIEFVEVILILSPFLNPLPTGTGLALYKVYGDLQNLVVNGLTSHLLEY